MRVHGLRGCNSLECLSQVRAGVKWRLWNRDMAAVYNMLDIVAGMMKEGGRPPKFRRGN